GVAVVARWARWLGRWGWRWRLGRSVLPEAARALGQRERRAELPRGDAVLAVDAVERADQLVLHGAATHGRGAEREQPGRERQQRLEHGRAMIARRSRATSAPGRRLDEICEHAAQLDLDATHPLGTWPTLGDELGDRPREPRAVVVGDDARADEREQKTGL